MTDTPQPTIRAGHFHAVRFYENAASLSRIVADFIGEGLAREAPALLVATPEHRLAIEAQLAARGFDTNRLKRAGQLSVHDAETMLRKFMRDGMPDAGLFRNAAVPILETLANGNSQAVVRAYGEMVDVLWRAGHTVAAVKLEMLWNELAGTHDFSLLCGYSMGSFYKSASVEEICEQHSHVISNTGEARLVG